MPQLVKQQITGLFWANILRGHTCVSKFYEVYIFKISLLFSSKQAKLETVSLWVVHYFSMQFTFCLALWSECNNNLFFVPQIYYEGFINIQTLQSTIIKRNKKFLGVLQIQIFPHHFHLSIEIIFTCGPFTVKLRDLLC